MQPDRGRLRELKEALLLGDPIDDRLRIELVGLLELLASNIRNPRGRPVNEALRLRAGVVGVLRERHSMKLELALNLVAAGRDDVQRARDRKSLKDAYLKLKASGAPVRVPEREVTRALAQAARRG